MSKIEKEKRPIEERLKLLLTGSFPVNNFLLTRSTPVNNSLVTRSASKIPVAQCPNIQHGDSEWSQTLTPLPIRATCGSCPNYFFRLII